jgi:hypothetical protein
MATSGTPHDQVTKRPERLPVVLGHIRDEICDRFRRHLSHFLAAQFQERLSEATGEPEKLRAAGAIYAVGEVLREEESLRIIESFMGEVVESSADSVTVVYHDEHDDLIEHQYEKRQFVSERIPAKGECLECGVFVVASDKLRRFAESQPDDLAHDRPRRVTGPHEF